MLILNIEPKGYSLKARRILEKIGTYVESAEPDFLTKETCQVLIMRIGFKVDASFIAQYPNLKVIGTNVTGLDHIDSNACREANIQIISLRSDPQATSAITASAEYTLSLLLSMSRRIPQAARDAVSGPWDRYQYAGVLFSELRVGIIGYGRNGKILGKHLKSLGIEFKSYDSDEQKKDSSSLSDFDELLTSSNVVVLCIDYRPENIGFFGADAFKKMRPESTFINTARGALIDESALIEAIDSRSIHSAAVDVIIGEEDVESNILIRYAKNNKYLEVTPHIAGCSSLAWRQTEEIVANCISELLT